MAEERTFTAIFEPCEEGGFVVSFPTFPELMTQGETLEEARVMGADLLVLHLGMLHEQGAVLPPNGSDAHRPMSGLLTVEIQAA